MLDSSDVTVADFTEADIEGFLAYWYDSDRDFLETMGVDPGRLPSRGKMREMLELAIERDRRAERPQSTILAIRLGEETVGVHEITHLTAGDSGILHAHIWKAEHRRRGIGIVSYVRAMEAFFERFDLARIVFESPAHNAGANRIKERLGIPAVGTGTIEMPFQHGALATVTYIVTPDDLPRIRRNMAAAWLARGNTVDGHGTGPAAGAVADPAGAAAREDAR